VCCHRGDTDPIGSGSGRSSSPKTGTPVCGSGTPPASRPDQLTGHSGRVNAVAIGRLGDRDVIVSGSADDTVRIWDITGHTRRVNAVAIGSLGDRDVIVSGSDDGTVRIWEPYGHPIEPAAACRVLRRACAQSAKHHPGNRERHSASRVN
jgi:WD40 repeat protein